MGTGVDCGANSWTGVGAATTGGSGVDADWGGSGVDATISEEVCKAQTYKMVTAITGRAVEGERTSEIAGLESAKAVELGMLTTHTDISGRSNKLEANLKCFWNTWVFLNATFMMTVSTRVTSMMAGGSGVVAMTAEQSTGSGLVAIL